MATQNLEIGIGSKETVKLPPKHVKIVSVELKPVGIKGAIVLHCLSKHPDREEPIDISSIKFEGMKKLRESGLFLNLEKKDDDKEPDKIQKNSPLAILMTLAGAKTLTELKGKEIPTTEGESGFLCFKAY